MASLLPSDIDSVRDRSYIFFGVMTVLAAVTIYVSWQNIVALSGVVTPENASLVATTAALCDTNQRTTITTYNLISLVIGAVIISSSATFFLTGTREAFATGYSLDRYALFVLAFAVVQGILSILSLTSINSNNSCSSVTTVHTNTIVSLVISILVILGAVLMMYLEGFEL